MMIRQLRNFFAVGRFRTVHSMARRGKPSALKSNPGWEIPSSLEYLSQCCSRPNRPFTFVQVGAFDGIEGDLLGPLIRKYRWQGILVEPQPDVFQILKKNYQGVPNIEFANVAIGSSGDKLTLYTRESGGVPVASVSKRLLITPRHSSNEIRQIDVPCTTLTQLIDDSKLIDRIDLLQVDTEGADFDVIRSLDFSKYAPEIIRYEHALLSEKVQSECIEFLAGQGYRFILEDRDTVATKQVVPLAIPQPQAA